MFLEDPTSPVDLDPLKNVDVSEYVDLSGWRKWALIGAGGLIVAWWIKRRVTNFLRSRRPAKFHSKMQPYAEGSMALDEEFAAKRKLEAAKIIATSSTSAIAGFEILEQVEAVFVDGFRRPEDAIEGLKAAAAMKGANAVVNVKQERTSSGKCAATGDALRVRKLSPPTSEAIVLSQISTPPPARQSTPPGNQAG